MLLSLTGAISDLSVTTSTRTLLFQPRKMSNLRRRARKQPAKVSDAALLEDPQSQQTHRNESESKTRTSTDKACSGVPDYYSIGFCIPTFISKIVSSPYFLFGFYTPSSVRLYYQGGFGEGKENESR